MESLSVLGSFFSGLGIFLFGLGGFFTGVGLLTKYTKGEQNSRP